MTKMQKFWMKHSEDAKDFEKWLCWVDKFMGEPMKQKRDKEIEVAKTIQKRMTENKFLEQDIKFESE